MGSVCVCVPYSHFSPPFLFHLPPSSSPSFSLLSLLLPPLPPLPPPSSSPSSSLLLPPLPPSPSSPSSLSSSPPLPTHKSHFILVHEGYTHPPPHSLTPSLTHTHTCAAASMVEGESPPSTSISKLENLSRRNCTCSYKQATHQS